jgi:hypothetical protein
MRCIFAYFSPSPHAVDNYLYLPIDGVRVSSDHNSEGRTPRFYTAAARVGFVWTK